MSNYGGNYGGFGGGLASFLAFIPNPIISANEAWFMSNTQKVHWLFHKLCEVIKKVNTYDELFAELKDILLEFDDSVRDAVEKYIKQMYEDGELESILQKVTSEYLSKMTYSKTSQPRIDRIWRTLRDTGLWKGSTDSHYFIWAQGGCAYKNSYDELAFAAVFLDNRHFTNSFFNGGMIAKFRPDNTEPTAEQYYGDICHSNGMTYNPIDKKFYACKWSRYPRTGVETARIADRRLYRVNETDLGGYEESVEFDRMTVNPYYYNGEIYGINKDAYNPEVFVFDWEENTANYWGVSSTTLKTTIKVPYGNVNSDLQYFAINRDKIFVFWGGGSAPKICVYDLENGGDVEWTYEFPLTVNYTFAIGEIENMSFVDDKLYIMSANWLGKPVWSQYTTTQVFVVDLYNNNVGGQSYDWYAREENTIEMYVGGMNSNIVNPEGWRTKRKEDGAIIVDRRFATLQEAVEAAENYTKNNIRFRINLEANNVSYTYVNGNANIVINGNKYYCGGIQVNGGKLATYDIVIAMSLANRYDDLSTPASASCLDTQYGTVYAMSGTTFERPTTANWYYTVDEGLDYGYSCNGGIISVDVKNPGAYRTLNGGKIISNTGIFV